MTEKKKKERKIGAVLRELINRICHRLFAVPITIDAVKITLAYCLGWFSYTYQ